MLTASPSKYMQPLSICTVKIQVKTLSLLVKDARPRQTKLKIHSNRKTENESTLNYTRQGDRLTGQCHEYSRQPCDAEWTELDTDAGIQRRKVAVMSRIAFIMPSITVKF
jgi:hypothetical protein